MRGTRLAAELGHPDLFKEAADSATAGPGPRLPMPCWRVDEMRRKLVLQTQFI